MCLRECLPAEVELGDQQVWVAVLLGVLACVVELQLLHCNTASSPSVAKDRNHISL